MFATIPVSLNKLTQQILHGFWFLQWRLLCLDRHERRKLRCEGDTLLTYHHGKWYSCVCLCAVCPSADMHFEATVKESILHSSVPEGCAHGQLGCKTLRKEQPFVQQKHWERTRYIWILCFTTFDLKAETLFAYVHRKIPSQWTKNPYI